MYPELYLNRLKCELTNTNENLFFSLVDYRNNYFTNNKPDKIIEFYDGFENRNQLIQWMKERPKGASKIYEVKGEKNIIVVIPTVDFSGKYAEECRENIFKGLHIIFVESGGVGDFYFNIAHNINIGIEKAMEYQPKWIVLSNDDMIKVDPIEILIDSLAKVDNSQVEVVFTSPSRYHSIPMFLAKPKLLFPLAIRVFKNVFARFDYIEKAYFQLRKYNTNIYIPRIKYSSSLLNRIIDLAFFKKNTEFVNISSFGIFSSNYLRKCNGKIYDETYINELEDVDLSIQLHLTNMHTRQIVYRINEYIGSTLGRGGLRTLRIVPSWSYFLYKMELGLSAERP